MTQIDDLYLAYKGQRKSTPEDVSEFSSNIPLDEVDELYSVYRRNRSPDYQSQIDAVMQVAEGMAATEKAVERIINESNVLSADSVVKDASNSVFNKLFNAPRLLLDKLKAGVGNDKQSWTSLAVPVVAVAIVTTAVVGYLVRDNTLEPNDSFELAQYSDVLTGYLDAKADNQLGFSGSLNSEVREFYLGVSAVDLKISHSAGYIEGIDSSLNRISALLDSGTDDVVIADVTALREKLEQLDALDKEIKTDTLNILNDLDGESDATDQWFELGNDIQSVYLASLLAIDKNLFEPLSKSINEFEQSFSQIGVSQFSQQELNAVQNILSYQENKEFSLDEIRSVRDSARDMKNLKLISGM